MLRYLRLVLFFSIAFCRAAGAGPLDEGSSAIDKGHYMTAYRLLRPLADGGNAEAQVDIGWMYEYGHAVARNIPAALAWYRRAAASGSAKGQANLAMMYRDGDIVPRNDQEAERLYRLAANQGDLFAQATLASMYGEGDGVRLDKAESARWRSLAARQGDGPSQLELGWMYEQGFGVRRSPTLAYVWYYLATTAPSLVPVEDARHFRDQLSSKMSAADVKRATEIAERCKSTDYKICE